MTENAAATTQIVARYTQPVAMTAYLTDASIHVLDRLVRAGRAAKVAADPRGRFGLEGADTKHVQPVIAAAVADLQAEAAPVIADIRSLRARGLTFGEVRDRLDLGCDAPLTCWAD